jgi:hypothetical protein
VVIYKQPVIDKQRIIDEAKKNEVGAAFAAAIQLKVSAAPTSKVPKISVQPTWTKPKFIEEEANHDAEPECFVAPLEDRVGISLEFSTQMDFKVISEPDLMFEV